MHDNEHTQPVHQPRVPTRAGHLPVYRGRRAERQHDGADDGELVEHVPRLVDVSGLVRVRGTDEETKTQAEQRKRRD